jgi:tRNA threonylcarbamoyl adenosine modification protein (Sua5/YciO/YrdC/YwlC family)
VIAAPASVPFWSPEEVEASLRGTIAHLHAGGVLAYPTETVYGFGTAVDHESVETLVRLKRRPPYKPFLLLVVGSDMLGRLGLHLTPTASRLAARHWPGPLTLVLPGGERRVPARLRGPEGGVAVRWTPHEGLTRLIRAYGEPITSTSANRPGRRAGDGGEHGAGPVGGRDRPRHAARARRRAHPRLAPQYGRRLHRAPPARHPPGRDPCLSAPSERPGPRRRFVR